MRKYSPRKTKLNKYNKMKLSKNFQLSEFACHDGTPVPESLQCNTILLANNIQVLRDDIDESLTILSGYRTPSWNKKVGGAPKSMHLKAGASDLTTRSYTPAQLHARILKLIKAGKMKDGGLGLYKSFVHYDIGPARRWKG